MSDENYVRLNLKKRGTSNSFYKRKSIVRNRDSHDSQSNKRKKIITQYNSLSALKGGIDADEVELSDNDSCCSNNSNNYFAIREINLSTTDDVCNAFGLKLWGLDPLDISINSLGNSSESNQIVSNISMSAEQKLELTTKLENLHSINNSAEIRGLVTLGGNTSLSNIQKNKANLVLAGAGELGFSVNECEEIFLKYSPQCIGHRLQAKLLTVKKPGPNKGKRFYGCTFPQDQRCKFFMWAEDNPALSSCKELVEMKKESNSVTLNAIESKVSYALRVYQRKLCDMTLMELKDEVRRCNRCLKNINNKSSILLISGSRDDVVARLEKHALARLVGEIVDNDIKVKVSKEFFHDQQLEVKPQLLHDQQLEVKPAIYNSDKMIELSDSDESESSQNDRTCVKGGEFDNPVKICVDSKSPRRERFSKRNHCSTENSDQESEKNSELVASSICSDDSDFDVTDSLRSSLLHYFGHKSFRQGQRWAIERSIAGKNSLLVMPTGSGKSLCYMLPSVILPGLTIVVSPLISLMRDQLKKLPVELPGACLSGEMTARQSAMISKAVLHGEIKILFVSPERLCTQPFRKLMHLIQNRKYNSNESLVSLLCVDEAHCLSQWSFNFRPAFLRIRKEIFEHIKPKAVLALTATATKQVQLDIAKYLNIASNSSTASTIDSNWLLVQSANRNNLHLSCSCVVGDDERRDVILKLLKSSSTENKKRPLTIVYVWKRSEADTLSEFLKVSGVSNVIYHAGMESSQREKSQRMFDNGSAKCVIATVAFGMGVDKADVRKIIHTSMPKSIENYLQEIGRAGRDGLSAKCSMLITKADAIKQHSLAQSNRITTAQIFMLLSHIFLTKHPKRSPTDSARLRVQLPFNRLETLCDINSAGIETVLTVLELEPFQLIRMEGIHYDTINGSFRVTEVETNRVSQSNSLIAALLRLNKMSKRTKSNYQSCPDIASDDKHQYGLGNGHLLPLASPKQHPTETYQPVEFKCSRLALSIATGLSVEHVTQELYALQNKKVLEYSMSDLSYHVELVDSPYSIGKSMVDILTLACKVQDGLSRTVTACAEKVIDMWRVASLIEKYSPLIESNGQVDGDNSVIAQPHLQEFVCSVMDNGDLSMGDTRDTSEHDMMEYYKSIAMPFAVINQSTSKRQHLISDILYLSCDVQVEAIMKLFKRHLFTIENFQLFHQENLKIKSAETSLQQTVDIILDLKCFVVCRVLHGLPTAVHIKAEQFRSGGMWGRHCDIHYDDLAVIVSDVLQRNNPTNN
eukprot:gene8848-11939_t